MVALPGPDGLPVTRSARRQQACGGNFNVYGVEKQRVKWPSSICSRLVNNIF